MTSLMLMLVLMFSSISQSTLVAYQTWDALSWEYHLPPLSIRHDTLDGDGLALNYGVDAQGRAVIVMDPKMESLSTEQVRKTIAHEAVHTMLRQRGMAYTISEEITANEFAFCWLRDSYYIPRTSCPDVLNQFKLEHR